MRLCATLPAQNRPSIFNLCFVTSISISFIAVRLRIANLTIGKSFIFPATSFILHLCYECMCSHAFALAAIMHFTKTKLSASTSV